jgi:hypothetical protein
MNLVQVYGLVAPFILVGAMSLLAWWTLHH